MRGERVPQGVRGGGFVDSGADERLLHPPLHSLFVSVMTALLTRTWIGRYVMRWEDVLPHPFLRGVAILHCKRVGQIHTPMPGRDVLCMERTHTGQMLLQFLRDAPGQHRHPVLCPFAISH